MCVNSPCTVFFFYCVTKVRNPQQFLLYYFGFFPIPLGKEKKKKKRKKKKKKNAINQKNQPGEKKKKKRKPMVRKKNKKFKNPFSST